MVHCCVEEGKWDHCSGVLYHVTWISWGSWASQMGSSAEHVLSCPNPLGALYDLPCCFKFLTCLDYMSNPQGVQGRTL